jgi:hypothetical protein
MDPTQYEVEPFRVFNRSHTRFTWAGACAALKWAVCLEPSDDDKTNGLIEAFSAANDALVAMNRDYASTP